MYSKFWWQYKLYCTLCCLYSVHNYSTLFVTWARTSSPAVVTADMARTRQSLPREILWEHSTWRLRHLEYLFLAKEALKNAQSLLHRKTYFMTAVKNQCCGAGAGGTEIIWDLEPEPGPKPKLSFNKYLLQSMWRMLGWIKTNFYLHWYGTTVLL